MRLERVPTHNQVAFACMVTHNWQDLRQLRERAGRNGFPMEGAHWRGLRNHGVVEARKEGYNRWSLRTGPKHRSFLRSALKERRPAKLQGLVKSALANCDQRLPMNDMERSLLSRITADPAVFGGKPVIRETRISVDLILGLLAQGASYDEVLDDYPDLSTDDIQACLAYAHAVVSGDSLDAVSVAGG